MRCSFTLATLFHIANCTRFLMNEISQLHPEPMRHLLLTANHGASSYGQTLGFLLFEHRDLDVARRFFKKAITTNSVTEKWSLLRAALI